jgi:hypothetical protein
MEKIVQITQRAFDKIGTDAMTAARARQSRSQQRLPRTQRRNEGCGIKSVLPGLSGIFLTLNLSQTIWYSSRAIRVERISSIRIEIEGVTHG